MLFTSRWSRVSEVAFAVCVQERVPKLMMPIGRRNIEASTRADLNEVTARPLTLHAFADYQFPLHSKHVIIPKYRFSSSLPVRVRADETRFPTQFLVFDLTVKLGSVTMAAALARRI